MSTDTARVESDLHNLETTWAARNPLKPVINARINVTKHQTNAESLTAHQRRVEQHQQAEALKEEIQVAHAACQVEVDQICKGYGRKKEYIEGLLNHATKYASTCRPSCYNALVHNLSLEMNKGEHGINF